MTFTWCSPCGSEVVDLDGFCMLGHRLGADDFGLAPEFEPPTVQAVSIPASVPMLVPPPPPPPPPPAPETVGEPVPASLTTSAVWNQLEGLGEPQDGDPISAFAPSPRMDWGPDEVLPLPKGLKSLLRRSRLEERLESLAG